MDVIPTDNEHPLALGLDRDRYLNRQHRLGTKQGAKDRAHALDLRVCHALRELASLDPARVQAHTKAEFPFHTGNLLR
jgi:hypothetical protein